LASRCANAARSDFGHRLQQREEENAVPKGNGWIRVEPDPKMKRIEVERLKRDPNYNPADQDYLIAYAKCVVERLAKSPSIGLRNFIQRTPPQVKTLNKYDTWAEILRLDEAFAEAIEAGNKFTWEPRSKKKRKR
jgi:hypothetical protein